jgi:hypothetical protein
VFTQWQRVFEFMDGRGEPGSTPFESLRPVIFQRMVWHLLQVLGHTNRVPRSQRRRYFRRMTEQYRRYLPPAGSPLMPGTDGIKQRLVARGAWLTFEVMMAVWLTVRPIARLARPKPQLRVPAPQGVMSR